MQRAIFTSSSDDTDQRPPPSTSPDLSSWIGTAALIGAGALIGFGIILWIAANWAEIGKLGRFGLAGGAVLAAALTAALLPAARAAGCLVGAAATGGLLALVGQTYQTGADPWQLFAVWAALSLPWALAARHDAVWLVFTVVAMTALPLWARAEAGPALWSRLDVLLPVWLGAAALTALLAPAMGLSRWIGSTRWSFRMALVLALGLVAAPVANAITSAPLTGLTTWLGLALIGLALAALVLQSDFDLPLTATTTLVLDGLMILLVGRAVLPAHGVETGAFLLIGLAAAGIVAASAVALLNVARQRGALPADIGGGRLASSGTWPIAVLSGVGAILAAVPFLVFAFMAFGVLLERGAGTYIAGMIVLAGATGLMRASAQLSFRQQLGVIGMAVGFLLLGYGLFRDLPFGTAALLLGLLATAAAPVVPARWIAGLLGAAAAVCLALWIVTLLQGRVQFDLAATSLAWAVLAVAGSLGLLALADHDRAEPAPRALEHVEPYVVGVLAAALLGVMWSAGPTFLVGASWGLGNGRLGTAVAAPELLVIARAISVLCAGAGLWLLARRHRELMRPIGLAVGASTMGLSLFSPSLGPIVLGLAVAVTSGRRALALLAAVGFIWVVGSFYYWLAWPLTHKAYLLIGIGAAIGAVCLTAGTGTLPTPSGLQMAETSSMRWPASSLVAVAALAAVGVAGHAVYLNERIIASGTSLFLPLAPVDPRSLMQGDYMALRFATPLDDARRDRPIAGHRLRAVVQRDARGVGSVVRIVEEAEAATGGELSIVLDRRNGRWSVGPDAYFFEEGRAASFEKARFGHFRVAPDGRAILVGLADETLQTLR